MCSHIMWIIVFLCVSLHKLVAMEHFCNFIVKYTVKVQNNTLILCSFWILLHYSMDTWFLIQLILIENVVFSTALTSVIVITCVQYCMYCTVRCVGQLLRYFIPVPLSLYYGAFSLWLKLVNLSHNV